MNALQGVRKESFDLIASLRAPNEPKVREAYINQSVREISDPKICGCTPIKIQWVQELKPNYTSLEFQFVNRVTNHFTDFTPMDFPQKLFLEEVT